jgi:hypothetical protein
MVVTQPQISRHWIIWTECYPFHGWRLVAYNRQTRRARTVIQGTSAAWDQQSCVPPVGSALSDDRLMVSGQGYLDAMDLPSTVRHREVTEHQKCFNDTAIGGVELVWKPGRGSACLPTRWMHVRNLETGRTRVFSTDRGLYTIQTNGKVVVWARSNHSGPTIRLLKLRNGALLSVAEDYREWLSACVRPKNLENVCLEPSGAMLNGEVLSWMTDRTPRGNEVIARDLRTGSQYIVRRFDGDWVFNGYIPSSGPTVAWDACYAPHSAIDPTCHQYLEVGRMP